MDDDLLVPIANLVLLALNLFGIVFSLRLIQALLKLYKISADLHRYREDPRAASRPIETPSNRLR